MSWDQLRSIMEENAQEHLARKMAPPEACPNDGEPLQSKENGIWFCPYDGWQWPRDGEGIR